MPTHTCKKCGQVKDVKEFRRHHKEGPYEPWNLRDCKECVHDEYIARYSTATGKSALNESSRKWKQNNKEEHARLAREYRARNKEKIMAQNRLNYAIRKGSIHRQPCAICGTTEKVHAHHHSYAPEHWYDVKWLRFECHKIEHAVLEGHAGHLVLNHSVEQDVQCSMV